MVDRSDYTRREGLRLAVDTASIGDEMLAFNAHSTETFCLSALFVLHQQSPHCQDTKGKQCVQVKAIMYCVAAKAPWLREACRWVSAVLEICLSPTKCMRDN